MPSIRPPFGRRMFLGALALAVCVGSPAAAAGFTAEQKSEIGAVVKDYLLANPEVLRDAMAELDKRQKDQEGAARLKVMADESGALFNSPYQVVLGNPNGKATIVEFFDYNCSYCKHALDDLAKLMKNEPELRVVLKDFPVLGPGSVEAAQVAGALRAQFKGDKYWEFHSKLLSSRGQVGRAQALAVAKDLGADMDKLARDVQTPEIRTGIEQAMQIADSLNLTGTPSYVVGLDVVVGAVGYDDLKGRIDNIVKCGKSVCS